MSRITKWAFRLLIVAFLLRIFAPKSAIYQAIAPFSEPIFEAIAQSLVALLKDYKNAQEKQDLEQDFQKIKTKVKVEVVEENPHTAKEDYSQVQEFDAVLPCQSRISYVTHLHKWETPQNQLFSAKFTVLPQEACQSESFREQMPEPVYSSSPKDYWGRIYLQLIRESRPKMERIFKTYQKIAQKYQLNYRQFAEMVVTSVQEIPYVLVHPESCYKAKQLGGFMKTYHEQNMGECLPNIRFGLTAPTEFFYNFKGDCDTRTVFLYTVLVHFGYDVAIFVGDTHSMLGIHLPNLRGDYLTHKGKKYYFWETTSKGFVPGVLPHDFRAERWSIALVKSTSQ